MKFMNMKRFASTVMAGVMTLSLAVPAFANSTVIDGSYNPITLAVTVPKTGKAIINPYGLPYSLDDTTSISGEQITTGAALMIQNRSVVALKVGAKVTGAVKDGSDLTLVASNATLSTTAKQIQAQFQAFEALGVTEANAAETEDVNKLFAALDKDDALLTCDVTTTETAATDKASTSGLILREANADGELQNGGAGFFRLSGAVTEDPTDAWDKLTDGFTTTIAFTFTPSTYVAQSFASLAFDTAPTAASDTAKVTATFPSGVKISGAFTYVSSDEDVATVNAQGTVTVSSSASSGDTADITVTATGDDGLPYSGKLTITIS